MLVTTSPHQFCYEAPLYFIFGLEMIVQKVLIQKKVLIRWFQNLEMFNIALQFPFYCHNSVPKQK